MARKTVVERPHAEAAREWAAGLETVPQVLGWLQDFERSAVMDAARESGNFDDIANTPIEKLDIREARAVAEVLYRWKLEGKLTATKPLKLLAKSDLAETHDAKQDSSPTSEPTEAADVWKGVAPKPEEAAPEAEIVSTRWKMVQDIRHREIAQIAKVATAEEGVEGAKGQLKYEEAKLETIRQELGEAIDGKPIQVELFPKKDDLPSREGEGGTPAVSPPSPEAWKDTPLASLDIPPGTLEKLAQHEPPLTTLGQLTDWQKDKGDYWAKDIKGVGPGAAEKIANACEKYWAEHPPTAPEPVAAAPEPADNNEPTNETAEAPAEELASA